MGSSVRWLTAAVAAGAVVLAGCTADPTRTAEYASVVAEREEALASLDTVSGQLDDLLNELDDVESELADVKRSLDDTLTASEGLGADLRAAEAETSDLRKRVAVLEQLLEAEPFLEIDQEVERVCAQILSDPSGDAVAEAALMISFDARWESHVTPADMENRVRTCVGFDYLTEIGLGAEFGDGANVVTKWVRDVRIVVAGSPTEADLAALDATMGDLNRLISSVTVSRASSGPSELTLHFIPLVEFDQVVPEYVPGNDGFFWVFRNSANELTDGTILIRSDFLEQVHRSHLVREEVTQAFGLMNDSFKYHDSIFQQSWTAVGDYAAIDEVIIALLYRPEVRPGMVRDEMRGVLDWQLGG